MTPPFVRPTPLRAPLPTDLNGRSGSTQSRQAKLYGKPAAALFQTLGVIHDRKHAAARPVPRDLSGSFRSIAAQPVRGIASAVVTPPVLAHAAFDDERLMTACIGGNFIAETRAGRTWLAHAVLDHLRAAGRRQGMDGLILTALLHLNATHDPAAAAGLDLWRQTVGSASGGTVTVFDSATNSIGSVGPEILRDPFGRGLALPAIVGRIGALHGGEVMDWGGWISAGCAKIGGALGSIIGVTGSTAAYGERVGTSLGQQAGDAVVGFIQDSSVGRLYGLGPKEPADTPAGPPAPDTPAGPPADTPAGPPAPTDGPAAPKDTPIGPPAPPAGDGSGGTDGNGGGNPDDPPKDSGWPNDQGYPAPDDGGGTPWSLIGTAPLIAVSRAAAMLNPAGGFASLAQVPGLAAQQSFAADRPLAAQVASWSQAARPDAAHLSVLTTALKTIDLHAGAIGPAARGLAMR